MTSVLISLLLALRGVAQSRALFYLEVLALHHPLQVLQRSRAAAGTSPITATEPADGARGHFLEATCARVVADTGKPRPLSSPTMR
jgi:hypothetical protein